MELDDYSFDSSFHHPRRSVRVSRRPEFTSERRAVLNEEKPATRSIADPLGGGIDIPPHVPLTNANDQNVIGKGR